MAVKPAKKRKPLWLVSGDGFRIPTLSNPVRAQWDAAYMARVRDYFGPNLRPVTVPIDRVVGGHSVMPGHPRTALYTRAYRMDPHMVPPIVVNRLRQPEGDFFNVPDGNRRIGSAKDAGLTEVPGLEIVEPDRTRKKLGKGENPQPLSGWSGDSREHAELERNPDPNWHQLVRVRPTKKVMMRSPGFRHKQTGQIVETAFFHNEDELPDGGGPHWEDGFVDHQGKFYTRTEAAQAVGADSAWGLESQDYAVNAARGVWKSDDDLEKREPPYTFVPDHIEDLARRVKLALTDDLRSPRYRGHPSDMKGHCYVAAEALFHLLGGKDAGWKPMHIRHEGEPHWFLQHSTGIVLDPTAEQFDTEVPYENATGKGFLTQFPSKRAIALMDRAMAEPPLEKAEPLAKMMLYGAAFRHKKTGKVYYTGSFHDTDALGEQLGKPRATEASWFKPNEWHEGFVVRHPKGPFLTREEAARAVGARGSLESDDYARGVEEGFYKGEADLVKMAIAHIVPGAETKSDLPGYAAFDYTHMLTPEQNAAGYRLRVYERQNDRHAHAKVRAHLSHNGQPIGGTVGYIVRHPADQAGALEPHSGIAGEHQGKGLGTAAYEAMFAHAYHRLGVRRITGLGHTFQASRTHSRIAQRHGLDYAPTASDDGYPGESGPFDYALKDEVPMAKMALKDLGPGKKVKERPDWVGPIETWDYSHLLPPKAQKLGYRMHVEAPKLEDYRHTLTIVTHPRHNRPLKSGITNPRKGVGFHYAEFVRGHDGPNGISTQDVFLYDGHRGMGIGRAMYEAAYKHAFDRWGVRFTDGGTHSTPAAGVHESLKAKHGFRGYHKVPSEADVLEGDDPEYRGDYDAQYGHYEYQLKSEADLEKAISEIRPGRLIGPGQSPVFENAQTIRSNAYDYTHVLNPVHQRQGYRLVIHDIGSLGGMLVALHHGSIQQKPVGQLVGSMDLTGDGQSAVKPDIVEIHEDHRGKRLGVSMYEAMLAHAHHHRGAVAVRGSEHSTSAHRTHRSLARKHGMTYHAVPNVGPAKMQYKDLDQWADAPETDYDAKFKPYEYLIRSEGEPMEKGVKGAVAAAALALAPGSIAPDATQPLLPASHRTSRDPEPLHPHLEQIGWLESRGGANMNHQPHSLGEYHTAYGIVGLKPVTAHEEYLRDPALQARFPGLHDKQTFTKRFKESACVYNALANRVWGRLLRRFRDPMKAAFGWRWGPGAAKLADPKDIEADSYVQQFVNRLHRMRKSEADQAPVPQGHRKRAVSVILLDPHGRFVMGRRNDSGKWTIPGGHVEDGEPLHHAALREAWEETGITPMALYPVGVSNGGPDGKVPVHVFYGWTRDDPAHGRHDPDREFSEYRWFSAYQTLPPDIELHHAKDVAIPHLGLPQADPSGTMQA